MACTIDGFLWKVTVNAIPVTQMVQVFSFKNMHNHSVDNSTFQKPVIHTKHGGALVDDLIKETLDHLPKKICKDFERYYGMRLSYVHAWSMKEKNKEMIHGRPWMCQRSLEGCIDRVQHDLSPSGGDDDADGVSYGGSCFILKILPSLRHCLIELFCNDKT